MTMLDNPNLTFTLLQLIRQSPDTKSKNGATMLCENIIEIPDHNHIIFEAFIFILEFFTSIGNDRTTIALL